ncbi:MAG TPA: M28 family metallopeptidase [Thermoanaerobaculia bacterium]|nr:M28 family metallopeptidase [Thermoanaerobaculia bacterium]
MFAAALVLAASLSSIDPAAIRAHIDFLASDLLEGRETGTRGFDIGARYVASQFALAGLEPHMQEVRLRTGIVEKATFTIGDQTFVHRKDVIVGANLLRESDEVDAEVVFAGFGIVAPGLHHDDYANVDVKGKIVMLLSGAPPQFPATQRAFFSDTEVKLRNAAERGATGVIVLRTLVDERRQPFERALQQPPSTSMMPLEEKLPEIHGRVGVNRETANVLFAKASMPLAQVLDDADKGIAHSFPLNVRAAIRTITHLGEARSTNVYAVLRGSSKPDEHVALTAHLDHLGLVPDGEDRVRNGALDNASGIAALLEIAKSIAAMPERPARSIVFVALTAEEKGGGGAWQFTEHPPVPNLVADVNMDMLTMLFPLQDLVAIGSEHSSLGALALAAATDAGFTVSPDPLPEEVRFIRSDQYAFVKKGIPAITYKGGLKSADPAIDGDQLTRAWLRETYHTVRDNPDQKIDYASGARWADANRRLILAIANAPERPAWNRGDFFGETFGK